MSYFKKWTAGDTWLLALKLSSFPNFRKREDRKLYPLVGDYNC